MDHPMDVADRSRLLAALVDRHYRLVYRFAYRLTGSAADAEDVTQQAFLTAQSRLDQLRDESRAGGWLCAIARTTWLKTLRNQNGEIVAPLEGSDEPVTEVPDDTPIDAERLQAILNDMPEEYRTPLILFYFDEFTYKDIAEHLEIPLGTVMSRLARGKDHLRRRLSSLEVVSVPQRRASPSS
jgi:RNA polymerase sigma-70 factor (ECF subfamily)